MKTFDQQLSTIKLV